MSGARFADSRDATDPSPDHGGCAIASPRFGESVRGRAPSSASAIGPAGRPLAEMMADQALRPPASDAPGPAGDAPRSAARREPFATAVFVPTVACICLIMLAVGEYATKRSLDLDARTALDVAGGCSLAGLIASLVVVPFYAGAARWLEPIGRRRLLLGWRACLFVSLLILGAAGSRITVRVLLASLGFRRIPSSISWASVLALAIPILIVAWRAPLPQRRIGAVLLLVTTSTALYWFHVVSGENAINLPLAHSIHIATGFALAVAIGATVAITVHGRAAMHRRQLRWCCLALVFGLIALTVRFVARCATAYAPRHSLVSGSWLGRDAARFLRLLLPHDWSGFHLLTERMPRGPRPDLGLLTSGGGRELGARALWGAPPRNLLLVTIDTLRADALDDPRLEALVRVRDEGVRIRRATSASSVTRVSLTAMLLGQHKDRQGVNLAEVMRDAGLSTSFFGTFPALADDSAAMRGFEYVERSTLVHFNAPDAAAPIVDAALAHLHDLGRRPFFVWAHFLDPHAPYDSPGDTERERYQGEITKVDRAVSRLFHEMDLAGQLTNTLVVLTADHGEEFGEHGGRWHGGTLYDEVTHIPMIFWRPGSSARGELDVPATAVDLGPTVLHLMDLASPSGFARDGINAFDIPLNRTLYSTLGSKLSASRGKWKLIIDRTYSSAELYDLATDPEERNNLVDERAEIGAAMGAEIDVRFGLGP